MPRTGAGQRNVLASVQRVTRTSDGAGGMTESWAEIATPWVAIEPLTGNEMVRASALTAELPTRVTMLFSEDVKVKDRIVIGLRTLEIQTVTDPDGRRAELVLLCTEALA